MKTLSTGRVFKDWKRIYFFRVICKAGEPPGKRNWRTKVQNRQSCSAWTRQFLWSLCLFLLFLASCAPVSSRLSRGIEVANRRFHTLFRFDPFRRSGWNNSSSDNNMLHNRQSFSIPPRPTILVKSIDIIFISFYTFLYYILRKYFTFYDHKRSIGAGREWKNRGERNSQIIKTICRSLSNEALDMCDERDVLCSGKGTSRMWINK